MTRNQARLLFEVLVAAAVLVLAILTILNLTGQASRDGQFATTQQHLLREDQELKALVTSVGSLAMGAAQVLNTIQTQRVQLTRATCNAQNKKHDDAVKILDRLIAQTPRGKHAQAQANRAATILFINALASHQDCAAAVKRVQVPHH